MEGFSNVDIVICEYNTGIDCSALHRTGPLVTLILQRTISKKARPSPVVLNIATLGASHYRKYTLLMFRTSVYMYSVRTFSQSIHVLNMYVQSEYERLLVKCTSSLPKVKIANKLKCSPHRPCIPMQGW